MYAIIENGTVVNIVAWDGNAAWQPPDGAIAVAVTSQTGSPYIGFAYSGGVFSEPPQPPVTSH